MYREFCIKRLHFPSGLALSAAGPHVWSVTSSAQPPTFPSDDAARGESEEEEEGRVEQRGEGVPSARSSDRQQGTAAAPSPLRISAVFIHD